MAGLSPIGRPTPRHHSFSVERKAMTSARCCGSVRIPAMGVPGTLALGLVRNSSRVSALQITPYFFMFSLGPRRLFLVPAWRPTTPTRLGPTFEVSSLVTAWQVGQELDIKRALPAAASP